MTYRRPNCYIRRPSVIKGLHSTFLYCPMLQEQRRFTTSRFEQNRKDINCSRKCTSTKDGHNKTSIENQFSIEICTSHYTLHNTKVTLFPRKPPQIDIENMNRNDYFYSYNVFASQIWMCWKTKKKVHLYVTYTKVYFFYFIINYGIC